MSTCIFIMFGIMRIRIKCGFALFFLLKMPIRDLASSLQYKKVSKKKGVFYESILYW